MVRTQKIIPPTKTTLSRSEKTRIYKALGFKNQTAYLKTKKNTTKNEAIVQAITAYNLVTDKDNVEIIKQRRVTATLRQYRIRIKKVVNDRATFTRKFTDPQFHVLLEEVQRSKKKFLISFDGSHYSLSDKKIDLLREQFRANGSYFLESDIENYKKSDAELIYHVKNSRMSFQRVERWGKNSQDNGAFFDKHHKTPFDLSDYQIYTETKAENYKNADSCFIHALAVAGVDDKKLNTMRSMIKTKNLPKCMLKMLCEKVNIRVQIKMITIGDDGKKKNNITYGKDGQLYKLGLINEHYFLIQPLEITRHAVEHFDDVKLTALKDWEKRSLKKDKKLKDGYGYKIDKTKFIDSFTLIKMMVEDEARYLYPMSLTAEIYKTTLSNKFNNIENLEYDEPLTRANEPREPKEKDEFVNEFFDFETTTDGKKHRPYLARVAGYDKVFVNTHTDRKNYDKWLGYQMLKFLVEENNFKPIRLYAHNAGYDIKFIFDFIQWDKVIERGHSLLRGYGKFYYAKGKFVKIEIQDTKAYLVCQLKDFSEMFKLDMKKEIIPYRMYNEKTMSNKKIWTHGMKTAEVRGYCENENLDFDDFLKNASEWGCIKDGFINIIKYSSEYCRLDCEVLKNGWDTFQGWMHDITGLNVNDFISISSLVDSYFRNEGVYLGVHEVSSYVREFIQRCMVGGRTMTRKNKKYKINKKDNIKISDYDACALYPSSMQRLGGYLIGCPKVLTALDYQTLETYDGYFIEIKVTKVKKCLAFPLMSYKTEEGIRNFTNDMQGKTMHVDKFMLEDCIEYHGLEFEIIRGYFYDEGRNMKLKTVISHLFNARLKAKKDKNPIQVVYKLAMNASYGKTLIKPFSEDTKIMTFKNAKTFISRQYNKIKCIDILSSKKWDELGDFDKLKIKIEEPINEHFNNAPCGCEVLSMSKRIMNEVMCLADDYGFKIYYQDTDSMHIQYEDVKKLSLTYAMKYGRQLTGKGMGQFHGDFESDVLKGEIYACESIFLGKKCYIDKLTDGHTRDDQGNLIYEYHSRMKGMNRRGIDHRADMDFDGDLMGVYEALYDGQTLEFDLCGGGQMPTFDYNSNGSISSKMEFIRKIKF